MTNRLILRVLERKLLLTIIRNELFNPDTYCLIRRHRPLDQLCTHFCYHL